MSLPSRPRAWLEDGALAAIAGHEIYVHASGGGEGLPVLFLHGYPSSSYDWRGVLEKLGDRRTVCFDFLGFGLSEKPPDQTYSLNLQADIAEAVWRRSGGGPVLLVAHDMGTSVATELLARDNAGELEMELAGVLLFNGSMILDRASLTLAQKVLRSRFGPLLARLSNERVFRAQFARLFSADHPLDPREAADQWALLANRGGHRILDRLTYYLHERVQFAERWHGALRDWPGRLELAWGMRDPVATGAVLNAILELRPAAPVTRLENLGHYPQLERPDRFAELIGSFDRV